MSNSFYRALIQAGARLGKLGPTARTLRSANGTRIGVSGCSNCVVSFLGLQVEFSILVCDLVAGTDAIIGTDVLGSVLPHTLDITEGGASLQLQRRDSALSGRAFMVGHCSIPPYSKAILHRSVRTTGGRRMPPSGLLEGLTLFAENTGLIVGRTLVGPVAMESTGPGFKFRPEHRRGSNVLRGGNDSTSFGNPAYYGTT